MHTPEAHARELDDEARPSNGLLLVLDRGQPIARIVPLHDAAGGLAIRPAIGSFHDIALPGPTGAGDNALTDPQAERKERS